MSRREFLARTTLATAALAAYPYAPLSADAPREERKGAGKKVVIVGAGLAGLAAGFELTAAGHEVVLLEAQSRPGGRVHTLREPFNEGLWADTGASTLPEEHDFSMRYVQEFGLKLVPWLAPELQSLKFVFHLNGQRLRTGSGVGWPFTLPPEEKQMGSFGMLQKYFMDALGEVGDPLAPDWPPESLRALDAMNLTELLRQKGASEGAITILKTQFYLDLPADGADHASALYMLRDSHLSPGTGASYKIEGGMDRLPREFARRLQEQIHYGARVVRIEHGPTGVEAVYEQGGLQQRMAGDYLVCAIPFTVLRGVEVSPPFSAEKRRTISELPYCSTSRVFLQTRRRFWIDEGLSGFASTDRAIKYVFESTPAGPVRAADRGLLEGYTSGPGAEQLTSMSEAERVRFALEEIEKVHPEVRKHVEGVATKCWDEDPWARGAYAYFKPGQTMTLLRHIAPPEGRVHFAGEHASAWPHWMQGALESGNRVAREINNI
jgi:monoamine oxidase